MTDLSVVLGGSTFANPVMVASGCGGSGRELAACVDLPALGAFVTRSITLDARAGAAPPRIVETPAGLLNSIGLQNPGLDSFLARELPWLAQQAIPAIVSIAANSVTEYAELARRIGAGPGVRGIEINLSVPLDAAEPRQGNSFQLAKVVSMVREQVPRGMPVLAKLALREDVVTLARAAHEARADAVVLVNAVPALMIDPVTLAPLPEAATGGLSGPAIRPLALRTVWQVHHELPDLPIVGVGGISSGSDAVAFIAAGASAVQVGTATIADPTAPQRVRDELTEALDARGEETVAALVGRSHVARATEG